MVDRTTIRQLNKDFWEGNTSRLEFFTLYPLQFLTQATIIFSNQILDKPRYVFKGISQSRILSRFLYILYISQIAEDLPKTIFISQFADDIAIYTKFWFSESHKLPRKIY